MNTVISCMIMQNSPWETRLLLIDPKRVELTPYNGIPHLITPVVVEPEVALNCLKGVVREMQDRYKLLEEAGARNIASYNRDLPPEEKMPFIVVAVDELADLMMAAPRDIEHSIIRLAQLGRATGIHMIVATQRPSVNVVTGLIKANFPGRISFAVASQVDSRTILDSAGAEKLLGRGDMLFLPPDLPKPVRIQGSVPVGQGDRRTGHTLERDSGAASSGNLTGEPGGAPGERRSVRWRRPRGRSSAEGVGACHHPQPAFDIAAPEATAHRLPKGGPSHGPPGRGGNYRPG